MKQIVPHWHHFIVTLKFMKKEPLNHIYMTSLNSNHKGISSTLIRSSDIGWSKSREKTLENVEIPAVSCNKEWSESILLMIEISLTHVIRQVYIRSSTKKKLNSSFILVINCQMKRKWPILIVRGILQMYSRFLIHVQQLMVYNILNDWGSMFIRWSCSHMEKCHPVLVS